MSFLFFVHSSYFFLFLFYSFSLSLFGFLFTCYFFAKPHFSQSIIVVLFFLASFSPVFFLFVFGFNVFSLFFFHCCCTLTCLFCLMLPSEHCWWPHHPLLQCKRGHFGNRHRASFRPWLFSIKSHHFIGLYLSIQMCGIQWCVSWQWLLHQGS